MIRKKIKKFMKKLTLRGGKRAVSKKTKTDLKKSKSKKANKIKTPVRKHKRNPIIEPNPQSSWESKATFNPAALYKNGMVHLLYRAMGDSDISVLGYASSEDGVSITEKLESPAYFQNNTLFDSLRKGTLPTTDPIIYNSGGGSWGGCEDPRLTLIDDKVYLTYTAFDGWSSARIALSWIKLSDFLKKKWDWSRPVLMSRPGEVSKNWVLFPEKINGKFAVLHSINPKFMIDYVDDLKDLGNGNYINSISGDRGAPKECDNLWLRCSGPPPIKTKKGWLLVCHVMDTQDSGKYKIGAILLDLKDPSKIIAKCKKPIIEPEEYYENNGWKAGVAYCCGAVVKKGELFFYYGGADTVCCVASVNLNKFLKELIETGKPKVKKAKSKKVKLLKK